MTCKWVFRGERLCWALARMCLFKYSQRTLDRAHRESAMGRTAPLKVTLLGLP